MDDKGLPAENIRAVPVREVNRVEADESWTDRCRTRSRVVLRKPSRVPRPVSRQPDARFRDRCIEDDAALLHHDHAIRDCERTVDALLGKHDGTARRVDRGEERLRPGDVELRRRLVEQEQLGSERERGGKAHTLQLAARELDRTPPREVRCPDVGERNRDPWPDQLRRHTEVLETEGDLVLDARHDDLILGILKDRRDAARELGRAVRTSVEPRHVDAAGVSSTVKMRDQAGECP